MIRPAKHLNLNTCVLRAAALLLSKLQSERSCSYEGLRESIGIFGQDADAVFLPTLHFLFLMGRVVYHPQNDSFEFVQLGGVN